MVQDFLELEYLQAVIKRHLVGVGRFLAGRPDRDLS
jgi:hypothetical protein